MMTVKENYKILGKYIKDMSSETKDIETYLNVKEHLHNYQLGLDINSRALKNKIIEVNTNLRFENKQELKKNKKFKFFPRATFGFLSGFISAPMGITGAMMNVPILRYFGYPISRAIGSSAAIGFVIASIGSIGFLTSGFLLKANLPLSLGFVNIPAFLIFIPITSFMARVGANMVHTTDKNKTQRMFGVFLYVIGTLFLIRFLDL